MLQCAGAAISDPYELLYPLYPNGDIAANGVCAEVCANNVVSFPLKCDLIVCFFCTATSQWYLADAPRALPAIMSVCNRHHALHSKYLSVDR
jgi:hypothetical protein